MNKYENAAWRNLPQGAMRPGGLKLTEQLLDLAHLEQNAKILDVGCGLGSTSWYLRTLGYQATGVDISQSLIQEGLLRYPENDLLRADAAAMSFEDSCFDAVLSECSLSVMPHQAVLKECYRLLKTRGKLLVSDLYAREYSATNKIHSLEASLMMQHEWLELLKKNNFIKINFLDCSKAFTEFAVRAIWEYGSLEKLFDCGQWCNLAAAKPGYFLLVAQKGE
ncbi:MAG: DVU_1556 family methyltransferase [Bacillota bacterium]|jgi:arsenite methyltransferase